VVTIRGTTFTNVTAVAFGNANATFTVVSREQLQATVPAQAATGPIRVTTLDGSSLSPIDFLVTRSSDLGLDMSVTPMLLRPGEVVLFTLVTSNLGPSVVTGVEISDSLPAGLQMVEVTSDHGVVGHTNGVVTGTVGALSNGTAVTVSISALAGEMGVFSNRASVLALEGDPIPDNNQATVSFTVIADAARTLDIQPGSAQSIVLSWPTSTVPLVLQSTAALGQDSVWTAVSNPPVVVQGRNVVTNEALGKSYYRLRGP
jgi:uncharacterized repeat protein (TIGR01451 family)